MRREAKREIFVVCINLMLYIRRTLPRFRSLFSPPPLLPFFTHPTIFSLTTTTTTTSTSYFAPSRNILPGFAAPPSCATLIDVIQTTNCVVTEPLKISRALSSFFPFCGLNSSFPFCGFPFCGSNDLNDAGIENLREVKRIND